MTTVSLKQIVNNILMKRNYPVHYTIDFLVYAKNCLRELTFDDLLIYNVKCLPLTNYNAIKIPPDYQDYVSVNVMVGQQLRPLVEDESLNPLYNYSTTFVPQPYPVASNNGTTSQTNQVGNTVVGNPFFFNAWLTVHWNDYGENTGRYFGGVPYSDTFKVMKLRNEIQINQNLSFQNVVLVYISNGQTVDSATHIDGYAQETIEAYCMWQFKENNRTYSDGAAQVAKQEYIDQRKILRARLSNLTIGKLKRIVNKTTIASPKD